jgi:hypothetical protein
VAVIGLCEEANDDYVFFLVVGGRAKTYAAGVEQFMRGGIERRSEILCPSASSFNVIDVVGRWRMRLSIK